MTAEEINAKYEKELAEWEITEFEDLLTQRNVWSIIMERWKAELEGVTWPRNAKIINISV